MTSWVHIHCTVHKYYLLFQIILMHYCFPNEPKLNGLVFGGFMAVIVRLCLLEWVVFHCVLLFRFYSQLLVNHCGKGQDI